MRLEGTLTSWNDERGFGRIASTQGGEPIFVHVSAWPRGAGRPQPNQLVSFEIELGPKGKRARDVRFVQTRSAPRRPSSRGPAQWGTATMLAIPAFLVLYAALDFLWKPPLWIAGWYLLASVVTLVAYAGDKSAASHDRWRTPESTLHLLAIAGGWPGALIAQQLLRHKSTKQQFRQVFWMTVVLNVVTLTALVSPIRDSLLGAL